MCIVYKSYIIMELAIPLIAMGGLYIASKQRNDNDENVCDDENEEGFVDYKYLPNTNLANVNFPSEYPVKSPALDTTTKLAHDNRYDGSSYTDKYFGLNHPKDIHDPNRWSKNNSQNDENSAQHTSLSGDTVDNSYFSHNNMVPFFGGKQTQRDFTANQNEGLMDSYLGKGSQTTALKIAKAAAMPAKMMETHLAPQRARTMVDYLFHSTNKRQRGTNPVRVWKDDGRDRGTAYLMVRLDQECERKYDRLRARCVCAVIRTMEAQGDYPSIAFVLKKLRSASSSTTQLFQKLICLTVQSMGRLILDGCASSASLSAKSKRPWLKRALTLFVQTCHYNEFYRQPHSENILLQAYAAVRIKSRLNPGTKTLTLRRVVKNLAKTYPEMQAIAIVKRSRLKLRTGFPHEARK